MQLGFVSDFVRMDAVGLIDSLGSHSFRANIIMPYCFLHSCRTGETEIAPTGMKLPSLNSMAFTQYELCVIDGKGFSQ